MIKNNEVEVVCNMCGKSYQVEGSFSPQIHDKDGLPIDFYHPIKIKQPGYPSIYDLTNFEDIHLCDKCFDDFIEDMEVKPKVH